jgi:uncharacterized SAM-binding protein YcdF (DUF218 family)
LGGAISGEDIAIDRGEITIGSAAERVTKGLELIRRFPEKPFIYSGLPGRETPWGMSEADAFKQLIHAQGLYKITRDTAHYESQSRNTYENGVFSRKIIENLNAINANDSKKPWLLITSATHMYRSVKVFEKQGINVISVPVDYQTLHTLRWKLFYLNGGANLWSLTLHEYIGIVAYKLTRKI